MENQIRSTLKDALIVYLNLCGNAGFYPKQVACAVRTAIRGERCARIEASPAAASEHRELGARRQRSVRGFAGTLASRILERASSMETAERMLASAAASIFLIPRMEGMLFILSEAGDPQARALLGKLRDDSIECYSLPIEPTAKQRQCGMAHDGHNPITTGYTLIVTGLRLEVVEVEKCTLCGYVAREIDVKHFPKGSGCNCGYSGNNLADHLWENGERMRGV